MISPFRHLIIDNDREVFLNNKGMKKLLKPRDIFLLGLGGFLDIFEEFKDPLGIMAKSYKAMYGFTPKRYRRHNYSHLIWRNLKVGYIEKIVKKGELYLRLTGEGREKIIRDFPLLGFQKKKWDGKWRIVLFDIAELNRKKRDMLRNKLRELGFGMFQKSVYISPHNFTKDLVEFLIARELSGFVYVFEIFHTQMAIGNAKELARKVWNLDSLNEQYLKLIEKISHLISTHDREVKLNNIEDKKADKRKEEDGKEKIRNIKEKIRDIKEEYLGLIFTDPFLPKELLSSNWAFVELTNIIRRL